MDKNEILKELLEQENTLVFTEFSFDKAYALGTLLYERAKERKFPIAIDITKSNQQMYHAALPGSTPDNDQWIIRKSRVVNRFHHSSFYIHNLLESLDTTIEEKYCLSSFEYSPHGGSFPIIIKDVGVIGTITVSGLPQKDDHAFVTSIIEEYLNSLNIHS